MSEMGWGMMELALLFFFIVLAIFGIAFLYGVYKLVRWLYKKCRKK